MNLTIKKKNELLDYAIERINQYDSILHEEDVLCVLDLMPSCDGCLYAEVEGEFGVCKICPFAIAERKTRCRPCGQLEKTPRKHQDDLIKAVNKWCKKFYPEFKVVRV